MTWRTPPFDRAALEAITHVRDTYAPLGIVISGSIVRGESGPRSDLDIFVVHAEPWRIREQKRFANVPAELFVNPAAQVRRYFASEHADGRPCTAHMFATGEPVDSMTAARIEPAGVIAELVREAHEWLAKPLEVSAATLEQKRYAIVDSLDDARDLLERDGAQASAALLLGDVVSNIVAYAFWQRAMFQPRRKVAVDALALIDARAAELVRSWADMPTTREALALVERLAQHVLGVDTFFAWSSARDPVEV